VGSGVGWHRHVTFAMLAFAYLGGVRKGAAGGSDPVNPAVDLLPPTVPKVRRLLWALVGQEPS